MKKKKPELFTNKEITFNLITETTNDGARIQQARDLGRTQAERNEKAQQKLLFI